MSRWVPALVLLLSACGEVVGPDYAGASLVSVHGQLTAESGVGRATDVKMALAWYPNMASDDRAFSKPESIVTQDINDPETFPLNYRFDIFAPPPEAAIGDLTATDGPARAAIGILLVYEDQNHNGRLDPMTSTGSSPDRVLGASWEFFQSAGYLIVYVDGQTKADSQNEAFRSLKPGLNLVGPSGVVPFTTEVPLHLTGESVLNLFVCEELFAPAQFTVDPPCGYTAPLESIYLSGEVELTDGQSRVALFAYDNDAQPVTEATVTFAGAALQNDGNGNYSLPDAQLTPGASYQLNATSQDGKTVATFTVAMPGDFSILTPAANELYANGDAVTLTWSASASADFYRPKLATPGGNVFFEDEVTTTNYTSGPVSHIGPAKLIVRAFRLGGGSSTVNAIIGKSIDLSFTQ